MRRAVAACCFATVLLAAAPARAGFYSGEMLYQVCSADRSDKEYLGSAYECVGYISGAVDAFNTTREANGLKSCIPAKVTISKLREVTVDYLRHNPEDRGGSASGLVFKATRAAWPCAQKAKSAATAKKPKAAGKPKKK